MGTTGTMSSLRGITRSRDMSRTSSGIRMTSAMLMWTLAGRATWPRLECEVWRKRGNGCCERLGDNEGVHFRGSVLQGDIQGQPGDREWVRGGRGTQHAERSVQGLETQAKTFSISLIYILIKHPTYSISISCIIPNVTGYDKREINKSNGAAVVPCLHSVLLLHFLLPEVDVLLAGPGVEELGQPLVVHAAVHKLLLVQRPVIIHVKLLKHRVCSLNGSFLNNSSFKTRAKVANESFMRHGFWQLFLLYEWYSPWRPPGRCTCCWRSPPSPPCPQSRSRPHHKPWNK